MLRSCQVGHRTDRLKRGARFAKPRILPDGTRPIASPARARSVQLFHSARFLLSVADPAGLPPPTVPEIAFAGRSNAGKSTAINILTQQRRLAYASKSPGRTQLINFFELSERTPDGRREPRAHLVDLPGYGYARAPAAQRAQWDALVGGYVARRQTLVGVVVVMDARHPLKPADEALLAFIEPPGCRVHLLLAKCDQLNRAEQARALDLVRRRAELIGPHTSTQLFSALSRTGVDELAGVLQAWLDS
jgi:GTP-binding protein